jgi:hypothetical protein
MTETFTSQSTSTINEIEMTAYENIALTNVDAEIFYDSIRVDLDLIERSPKAATIQNILKHSQSLR